MADYGWIAERWRGYVPPTSFEEYSEKYAEFFSMKRENGIIEVALQTNGGPYEHSWVSHNAWNRVWQDLGNDPQNEVLIFTGTGDRFFTGPDWEEMYKTPVSRQSPEYVYQHHYDGRRHIESFVNSFDIPTIGVLNGPGTHWEIGLFCDITLATEDIDIVDVHFPFGVPPGDGMGLILQTVLGPKRASYYIYEAEAINGQKALELGLVNQVLPREDLMPRAREIAGRMMKRSRASRRLTHAITVRPWKKALVEDFNFQISAQMVAELTPPEDIPPLIEALQDLLARKAW